MSINLIQETKCGRESVAKTTTELEIFQDLFHTHTNYYYIISKASDSMSSGSLLQLVYSYSEGGKLVAAYSASQLNPSQKVNIG